ncbi:hypothetical protein ACIQZO_04770 [Streptomyces sp. NPDC097617]|uniref:hypothetical protein n=1 Tax=Streptomyces sp. NPDC097617 TaxID=3366091 RepID=UPI00382D776D
MTTPAAHGHPTPPAQPQATAPAPVAAPVPTQPCAHTPHTPHATPAPQGPADPHPPQATTGPGGALIGLRSALVLVLGILVGTGAGVLTYLAQHNTATSVLAGGAAFAGSVLFFHNIIAG